MSLVKLPRKVMITLGITLTIELGQTHPGTSVAEGSLMMLAQDFRLERVDVLCWFSFHLYQDLAESAFDIGLEHEASTHFRLVRWKNQRILGCKECPVSANPVFLRFYIKSFFLRHGSLDTSD